MFDNIFEADFFDDDIVEEDVECEYDDDDVSEEDVDIFDENYFEATEGNPDNKGKKKDWEKSQISSANPTLTNARLSNRNDGNVYVRSQRHNLAPGARDVRDRKLAGRTGGNEIVPTLHYNSAYAKAKRHLDNENSKYFDEIRQTDNPSSKYTKLTHKNIVREMNHPSKK